MGRSVRLAVLGVVYSLFSCSAVGLPHIVTSLRIQDQNAANIGTVEVRRGEQAADAAHRFCEDHELPYWFYEAVLQKLCDNPPDGLLCTRDAPLLQQSELLFSSQIIVYSGNILGDLKIYAGQEPTDVILEFCKEHQQPDSICHSMVVQVCQAVVEANSGLRCSPLLLHPYRATIRKAPKITDETAQTCTKQHSTQEGGKVGRRWLVQCDLPPFDPAFQPTTTHRDTEPVLIFQTGKVASSSVWKYMKQAGFSAHHTHEGSSVGKWLKTQSTSSVAPIWVVTMTRNRFERDASALFQNREALGLRLDRQNDFLPIYKRHYFPPKGMTNRWFSDVFYPVIGVDPTIHAANFSFAARSLYLQHGRYRILVLRFEDIAHWPSILMRYFPIPRDRNSTSIFPHVRAKRNQLDREWHLAYLDFLETMQFTSREIDYVKKSNFAQFYNECEQAAVFQAAKHHHVRAV